MPFTDQLTEPLAGAVLDTADEESSLTDMLLGPKPGDDRETTFFEETKADLVEKGDSNLESDIVAAEKKGQAFTAKFASYKEKLHARPALYHAYRIVIATLGCLIVLGGLIMLVTPGPGLLAIFLGLGILATEFSWAHRLNTWAKKKARDIVASAKEKIAKGEANKEELPKEESSQEACSQEPSEPETSTKEPVELQFREQESPEA